jgi:hypothetical protein
MSEQEKLNSTYDSTEVINQAFIETFMRIQKACKTNIELSKRIEEYFKDKTKFNFSISRSFETSK